MVGASCSPAHGPPTCHRDLEPRWHTVHISASRRSPPPHGWPRCPPLHRRSRALLRPPPRPRRPSSSRRSPWWAAATPAARCRLGRPAAREAPLQATVIGAEAMRDSGGSACRPHRASTPPSATPTTPRATGTTSRCAASSLDNRYNYRRDGLPINAETSIPLDNKARIESSRARAASRPAPARRAGWSNYVVKRPPSAAASAFARMAPARQRARRRRPEPALRHRQRVRRAPERSSRAPRPARARRQGRAQPRARAGRRLAPGRRHAARSRGRTSHRSQPSGRASACWATPCPRRADPRINLNNQPWSQPVVFDGTTGSLRCDAEARGRLALRRACGDAAPASDDRMAFPFGCTIRTRARRHLLRRPLLPERHLRPLRLSQRERAAPQRRARPRAARQAARPARIAPRARVRRAANPRARPLAAAGVQLRWAQATSTAPPSSPPDPTLGRQHDPRRTLDRALRCATRSRFDAALDRLAGRCATRASSDSVDRRHDDGFSSRSRRRALALSYAFARDQMVYASWGQGVENRAVAPSLPVLHQRQPGAARAEEQAGRGGPQGRAPTR